MQRLPRIVELLLVVALAALVALWVTRILAGAPIAVPPPAAAPVAAAGGRVDAVLASARLFGSRRPGVLSDNVRALGVVADASGRGSVIVSVDGQAPKVYRVGDTLDGRLVAAIRPEEIELDANGARQVFRLPPPQATATGVTVLGTGGAAAAPGAASPAYTPVPPPASAFTPVPPPPSAAMPVPPPAQGRAAAEQERLRAMQMRGDMPPPPSPSLSQ